MFKLFNIQKMCHNNIKFLVAILFLIFQYVINYLYKLISLKLSQLGKINETN